MVDDLPAGPFDVVLVAYNSLFNLEDADRQRGVLRRRRRPARARRRVRRRGVRARGSATRRHRSSPCARCPTARSCCRSPSTTPSSSAPHGHLVQFADGERVRLRPWAIRYAPPGELDAMARRRRARAWPTRWEDFARHPFGDDSPRHVSVYAPGQATVKTLYTSRGPTASYPGGHCESDASQPTHRAVGHDRGRAGAATVATSRRGAPRSRPIPTVRARSARATRTPPSPALETVDDGGGWRMRVIPNLYPAFDGDVRLRRPPPRSGARHRRGQRHPRGVRLHARPRRRPRPARRRRGGRADARPAAPARRPRRARPRSATRQVIINHGREAGASLAHPHAQILGLPFVPGEILDEERAFARFAGGCVICTTDRGRAGRRRAGRVRRRRRRVHRPVLERRPVRAAADAAPPRAAPAGRRRGSASTRWARRSATPSATSTRPRRRRLQPRLPHRAARARRPVPLARPPVAEPRHVGRLRAGHRRDDQRHPARAGGRDAAAPSARPA